MKCIFICVFNQEKYIDMFYLLLESLFIYGKLDDNTKILVYTSTPFMNIIKQSQLFNEKKVLFEINDSYHDVNKACRARLDLFQLKSSINYSKFLYLDTDIIVKGNINLVFDVIKYNILYVLEEGSISWTNDFYDQAYGTIRLFGDETKLYKDTSAFTSGILLFNNCEEIKVLFQKINEDIINRPFNFGCHDQPYIVYNAFKYNLFNNKVLKSLVVNNDKNIYSNKVIHHFPGGPGVYEHKINTMTIFLNSMKTYKSIDEIVYKTYTWNQSYITFLANCKIVFRDSDIKYPLAKGYYQFIDKYTIKAIFNGREHNIIFKDNYTTFSSTRIDDLNNIIGKIPGL